jgi:hypothetical protein
LFLAVLLLTNVWGLSTIRAALVASTIPLAMVAGERLSRLRDSILLTGAVLIAGGLGGMALVPERRLAWAVASLALAGAGLGLVIPRLTIVALAPTTASPQGATWALVARHAGLVFGLLVLTPVLSADLSSARERARLTATARALEAPVPATAKLRLAVELAPTLPDSGHRPLPDLAARSRGAGPSAELAGMVDESVRASFTRGFRRSFLVAAGFALLALFPLGLLRRRGTRGRLRWALPAVAALATVSLLGAELGRGALAYGAAPAREPCAARPAPAGDGVDLALQRAALRGLDTIACRLGKGREQLLIDLADEGVRDARIVRQARTIVGELLGRHS